ITTRPTTRGARRLRCPTLPMLESIADRSHVAQLGYLSELSRVCDLTPLLVTAAVSTRCLVRSRFCRARQRARAAGVGLFDPNCGGRTCAGRTAPRAR